MMTDGADFLWELLTNCADVEGGYVKVTPEHRWLCDLAKSITELIDIMHESWYSQFNNCPSQDNAIYVAISALVGKGLDIAKRMDRSYDPEKHLLTEGKVIDNSSRTLYQRIWMNSVNNFTRKYREELADKKYDWFDPEQWWPNIERS